MNDNIINFKGILYRHGDTTIEGGGFIRPSDNKQEEYDKHWDEEDDLRAARGVFGLPLLISCILSASIVCGLSYWLDNSF